MGGEELEGPARNRDVPQAHRDPIRNAVIGLGRNLVVPANFVRVSRSNDKKAGKDKRGADYTFHAYRDGYFLQKTVSDLSYRPRSFRGFEDR